MFQKTLRGLVLAIAGVAAGVALHTAASKGETVFAGKRPSGLGVSDGRLAAPKRTPNCVSSQADQADAEHYIAPIRFAGSPLEAMTALRKVVEAMDRTLVVRHEADYLYAEFTSRLMGYVDDVEFLASAPQGVIHVRSASRLGRKDFGVNRERIEAIRARFAVAQGKAVKT